MFRSMLTHLGQSSHPPHRFWIVLAFAAVYLIWGSTYFAIRVAIETMPPFFLGAVRYTFAGWALLALLRSRGIPWPTREQWRAACVIGILMLLAGNGLVAWAEQYVASSHAALMVATAPGWFAVFDWMRPGGQRPSSRTWLGVLMGFGGVALLVLVQRDGTDVHAHSMAGAIAVLVATLCWAGGAIYSKHSARPNSPWMGAATQMVCGGAALFLLSGVRGEVQEVDWATFSGRSWTALMYLIVFGSWIAYSAYVWLLKVSTPSRVSTTAFVNPVVAVLLGWGLAGEELSPPVLLALPIILGAVLLLIWPQEPRSTPT